MKNIKRYIAIFFAILSLPTTCLAYSNEIVLGGDNIGISIENKGVIIIGFYKINNEYNSKDNNLLVGDTIIKINDTNINTILDLEKELKKYKNNDNVKLTLKRNNKNITTNLKLIEENGILKTGLYVKDNIKGIGTITYIDPETKIFGSLGHVIETTSNGARINVLDGYIFNSSISSINKSIDGSPGEKNAKFYKEQKIGTINKNTIYGIFGNYEGNIDNKTLIEVADNSEVKIGPAKIYTVIKDNLIDEFDIEIIKINETSNIKNITFKITDKKLLDKTGGIVQGMSGSPIVQNNKIVGAVTHVIVDEVDKGYGLFIKTMLKEGDN